MTSEYAQFRQWEHVSEAIGRLAHRSLDPVVITETHVNPEGGIIGKRGEGGEGETAAAIRTRVLLLIVDTRYAFAFRALEHGDWRIEMSVAFADNDDTLGVPLMFLQTKFDASASQVALEILALVE